MARNKFVDPASLAEYDWPINHDAEEAFGKTRNVTHDANTANVGFVRQQAPSDPLTIRLTGTILQRAQYLAMWDWYNACEAQTIYFDDFAGNRFEVLLTSFQPIRKRVAINPRDQANAPDHVWTYSLEMDVIRVVSGAIAGHVT